MKIKKKFVIKFNKYEICERIIIYNFIVCFIGLLNNQNIMCVLFIIVWNIFLKWSIAELKYLSLNSNI